MYSSYAKSKSSDMPAYLSSLDKALLHTTCINLEESTPQNKVLAIHRARDKFDLRTAELEWLEHLWNHENMFLTGVIRANEV